MKSSRIILVLITVIFLLSSTQIIHPNYQREKSIYNQNLSEIFDGVHRFIDYKHGKFSMLEIYDESNKTAVLFLHGRGLNPNEQNLINPMRVALSELGNNTYSIQLPVLAKGATYNEYIKIFSNSSYRIQESLNYILEKNTNIILIAHSCGVHMLMDFIDNFNLPNEVSSLVLIGSGAVDKGQKLIEPYPYSKISPPILDLYGEFDFDLVIKQSKIRLNKIKKVNMKSSQIMIKSSDHYHTDNAKVVIDLVKKWLSNQ